MIFKRTSLCIWASPVFITMPNPSLNPPNLWMELCPNCGTLQDYLLLTSFFFSSGTHSEGKDPGDG